MKHAGLWAIGIGVFASLGLVAAQQQAQGGPGKCSLATLRGLYMFSTTGWAAPSPKASLVPEGVTGYDIFRGNGKFESLATISLGGTIIPNVAAPGTYKINSDCTGQATVIMKPPTSSVHLDLFVVPDGSAIFEIQTDPGNVLAGTEQRVAP